MQKQSIKRLTQTHGLFVQCGDIMKMTTSSVLCMEHVQWCFFIGHHPQTSALVPIIIYINA